MHQQIRTAPTQSPADLRAFLAVLKEANINIQAAGGSDIERGGEFAFSVADGTEDDVVALLQQSGYRPRKVDVDHFVVTNEPGELLACVTKVAATNARLGRVIRDLAVGVDDDGAVVVQVYSEAS